MDQSIHQAVGQSQPNDPADVKVVQALLNKNTYATGLPLLPVDGQYTPATQAAIEKFQRKVLVMKLPDGVVSVSGMTFRRLSQSNIKAHVKKKTSQHRGDPLAGLSEAQFQAAALALSSPGHPCEVATIKAVSHVEAPRGAFDDQGRPTILFERHIFHKLTDGAWDDTHPGISDPTAGGYGTYAAQYGRLDEAETLNAEDALQSASWGAFQIMGGNYAQAGFNSVDDFVAAMKTGVTAHLNAFVSFIKNDPVLLKAIQDKDWRAFALKYNGHLGKKGHYRVRDHYDTRLSDAYKKIVADSTPTAPTPAPTPAPGRLP